MEPTSKLVLCESKKRRDRKREGEREERGGKEKEESKYGWVLGEEKGKEEKMSEREEKGSEKKGKMNARKDISFFFLNFNIIQVPTYIFRIKQIIFLYSCFYFSRSKICILIITNIIFALMYY